jgi:hypothetical protein
MLRRSRGRVPVPAGTKSPLAGLPAGTKSPLAGLPAGTKSPLAGLPAGTKSPLAGLPAGTKSPLAGLPAGCHPQAKLGGAGRTRAGCHPQAADASASRSALRACAARCGGSLRLRETRRRTQAILKKRTQFLAKHVAERRYGATQGRMSAL